MKTVFPNGNTHVDGHKLALDLAFGPDKLLPSKPDGKAHRDLSQCPKYRQLMRHFDSKK